MIFQNQRLFLEVEISAIGLCQRTLRELREEFERFMICLLYANQRSMTSTLWLLKVMEKLRGVVLVQENRRRIEKRKNENITCSGSSIVL